MGKEGKRMNSMMVMISKTDWGSQNRAAVCARPRIKAAISWSPLRTPSAKCLPRSIPAGLTQPQAPAGAMKAGWAEVFFSTGGLYASHKRKEAKGRRKANPKLSNAQDQLENTHPPVLTFFRL